jgi:hypothetical protein
MVIATMNFAIIVIVLAMTSFCCVATLEIVPIICEAPAKNITEMQLEADEHLPCLASIEYLQLAIGHALNVYADQEGLLTSIDSLPYPDFSDIWWENDVSYTDDWHDDYYNDDDGDGDNEDNRYERFNRRYENDRQRKLRSNNDSKKGYYQSSVAAVLREKVQAIAMNINRIETNVNDHPQHRNLQKCQPNCKKECTAPVKTNVCFVLWCGYCTKRRRVVERRNKRELEYQSLAKLAMDELRLIADSGTVTDSTCLQFLKTAHCKEDTATI